MKKSKTAGVIEVTNGENRRRDFALTLDLDSAYQHYAMQLQTDVKQITIKEKRAAVCWAVIHAGINMLLSDCGVSSPLEV